MDSSETLTIGLIYADARFTLPKAFIRQTLPESIFATCLDLDPEAEYLPLTTSEVTPAALRLLVGLAHGQVPTKHEPTLQQAHRYLNLPRLLIYAEPLYDELMNPNCGLLGINQQILLTDNLVVFQYVVEKYPAFLETLLPPAIAIPANGIARYILERRPDLHKGALQRAIQSNNPVIVQLTIKTPDIQPRRCLGAAVEWGHHEIVRIIMDAHPRLKENSQQIASDLAKAAMKGYLAVVKILLEVLQSTSTATEYHHPLAWAAEHGRQEVVQFLLQNSSMDPGYSDNHAIRWAARNGHLEIVKLLLADSRVNPSTNNNEAFRWAQENRQPAIAALLQPLVTPLP